MIGEWRQYTSTLTSVIWFRAQSLANMSSMWIPTTPHFLTFDILKQGTVFYDVVVGGGGGGSLRGLRYLKRCLQALPFPLSAVFRSFVFFALPHWPRAWHGVLHSCFERNLDSADKSSRKQCDVMMTSHHVIVSIKLCLDVGNDEYIILLHSPWHAGTHLTPNYSDVTVAMNPCTLPYNVPISTSSKSYNLYGMLLLSSVQSAANTTTSFQFTFRSAQTSCFLELFLLTSAHEQSPTYIQDLVTRYTPPR